MTSDPASLPLSAAARKRVCLIHTGGTIGMTRTSQGYAPQAGYLRLAITDIRELQAASMPLYELIEFDPLLDSANIGVTEWIALGQVIFDRYADFDGFVVLHGTDTMAYTAAALSFMLENLGKPVVITGSQIPLCEIRNDARDNIITALLLAANPQTPPEVCLYFGTKLFRGNRATKVSADDLIAFDSPNFPALAEVGVKIAYSAACQAPADIIQPAGPLPAAEVTREDATGTSAGRVSSAATAADSGASPDPRAIHVTRPLRMALFTTQKIAVLKIFPGIQFDLFANILTEQLGGLVLEAFGSGNIPESESLRRILARAEACGTIIVVCTQCLRGAAVIGQYQASSLLRQAGAVSGFDMTVEAAVTKLYYLLSLGLPRETVKQLMQADLRGEISTRPG